MRRRPLHALVVTACTAVIVFSAIGAVAIGCNGAGPVAIVEADGGDLDATTASDALTCGPGTVACGDRCVDVSLDPAHCGACGRACPDGQVCAAGACGVTCVGGTTSCQGRCVDTQTSRLHCGACRSDGLAACAAGEVCSRGVCRLACAAGLVACAGGCVDPTRDRRFCGATGACGVGANGGSAGKACAPGQICSAGACALSCPRGQIACRGACVDPLTDGRACGATAGCGEDGGSAGNVCASGHVCNAGACAASCPSGLVVCAGVCIDPISSPTHCGATLGCGGDGGVTGAACRAGQVCSGGACRATCQSGLVTCGGGCFDPQTSRTHCGATDGCGEDGGAPGAACASGNVCSGGACRATCQGGLVACGGGCVDPQTSARYCGATPGCGDTGGSAGSACAMGAICNFGVCDATCGAGLVSCGATCVDPATSATHCGATPGCGNGRGVPGATCGAGRACIGGKCEAVCSSTQPDLCGAGATLRCVDLKQDALSCGRCDYACFTGSVCRAATCVCPAGAELCAAGGTLRCEPAGTCPAPGPVSCSALHVASPSAPSGTYAIDPDGAGIGAPFLVYCDMTTAGGGFTLALKADSNDRGGPLGASRFEYDSALWTTSNASDPLRAFASESTNLAAESAKLESFNTVPFTEILIGLAGPSAPIRYATMPLPSAHTSLRAMFATGTAIVTTAPTRAQWLALIPGAALQPSCNLIGVNLANATFPDTAKTRLGILADASSNCLTPDSYIGVGNGNGSCGGQVRTVGNTAACNGDANVSIPAFAYIFVR